MKPKRLPRFYRVRKTRTIRPTKPPCRYAMVHGTFWGAYCAHCGFYVR